MVSSFCESRRSLLAQRYQDSSPFSCVWEGHNHIPFKMADERGPPLLSNPRWLWPSLNFVHVKEWQAHCWLVLEACSERDGQRYVGETSGWSQTQEGSLTSSEARQLHVLWVSPGHGKPGSCQEAPDTNGKSCVVGEAEATCAHPQLTLRGQRNSIVIGRKGVF